MKYIAIRDAPITLAKFLVCKSKEQNASILGKLWENKFSRSGIPTHLAE